MKNEKSTAADALRKKAEKKIKTGSAKNVNSLPEADILKLIQELEVHQIELEMQNEELHNAKVKAEDAAKDFVNFNNETYNFSPAGYFNLAPDGTIINLNFNGALLFGKERDDLIHSNFRLFISQASLPVFNEFSQKAFATNLNQTCEINLVIEGKPSIYVYLEGRVPTYKKEFLLTAVDITRLKRTEKALSESEVRFKSIFDHSTVAIYETDLDGKCLLVNKQWCKFAGMTPDEANGDGWLQAIHTDDRNRIFKLWNEHAHGHNPWNFEYRFCTPDQKITWVMGTTIPLKNEQGEKTGYLGMNTDITERKQMEEELRSNYSLLRIAGEATKFGGWSLDLAENKIIWSDVVARIHETPSGYSATIEDGINFYAPEYRDRITRAVSDCIEKGISYDMELELITAKGNRVWVRAAGEAVRAENGKIIKIQGAFQDITDQKRTEDALQKSRDLFSLFMNYSPIFAFIKEVTPEKSIVLQASDNYRDMVGISGKEMEGKSMEELFPVEFAAKITADDWAVISGGKVLTLEEELNGRSYTTIKFPILHRDKNLMAGYTIDVTDQKLQERELRESEARFRSTFDHSPVGSVMVGLDARFIKCNAAFCDFVGYSENELIGKTIADITYPEDRELGMMEMNQLVEGKIEIARLQKRYVRKDGRVVWGELSICVVCDADNKPNYFLPIILDITEHKQAEEDLVELNKRLKELNVTKDKFFSIIAHDLKNPFNSIIGFSNILAEHVREIDIHEVEDYAGIIQRSSKRAMDLLTNLLEWSRLQTGRIEFHPEHIDLIELIERESNLLSDTAKLKSIDIAKQLPENATAFADKSMIGTVLRNLISNALKFSHPGDKIVISVEQKSNEYEIAVIDKGIGIKNESLGKLFHIEESYSTTGTQNEQGTGLGLILCKEFIEKHKGEIWVESEAGKGSAFRFKIPII